MIVFSIVSKETFVCEVLWAAFSFLSYMDFIVSLHFVYTLLYYICNTQTRIYGLSAILYC